MPSKKSAQRKEKTTIQCLAESMCSINFGKWMNDIYLFILGSHHYSDLLSPSAGLSEQWYVFHGLKAPRGSAEVLEKCSCFHVYALSCLAYSTLNALKLHAVICESSDLFMIKSSFMISSFKSETHQFQRRKHLFLSVQCWLYSVFSGPGHFYINYIMDVCLEVHLGISFTSIPLIEEWFPQWGSLSP